MDDTTYPFALEELYTYRISKLHQAVSGLAVSSAATLRHLSLDMLSFGPSSNWDVPIDPTFVPVFQALSTLDISHLRHAKYLLPLLAKATSLHTLYISTRISYDYVVHRSLIESFPNISSTLDQIKGLRNLIVDYGDAKGLDGVAECLRKMGDTPAFASLSSLTLVGRKQQGPVLMRVLEELDLLKGDCIKRGTTFVWTEQ
ncbi:hypothetical protein RQP46_005559 [Phenoliferia psychrophenolica]